MNIVNTIMTDTNRTFKNANEAFDYLHDALIKTGVKFSDTVALFNVGFYMENPSDKIIRSKNRKWNQKYAEAEWQWYLSGDPRISKLGELYGSVPPIWEKMADENGEVNSNYGYQWRRCDQIDYVVAKLKDNPETRHAAISIYDAKEWLSYKKDTPCTYAIQFTILNNKLCMSVYMRSNDLWYGFCNDQYQFASLQELVAEMLSIKTGSYYHHAHNLHLYNNKL